MTEREALESVVAAWEALRKGYHHPHEVEHWMQTYMWHAVNDAREALSLPRSDVRGTDVRIRR